MALTTASVVVPADERIDMMARQEPGEESR